MKPFITKLSSWHMLSVLAAAFAFMGWQSSAFALTTQSAVICKPGDDSSTPGLNSRINGVFNYSGGSLGVVCPVVRTIAAPAAGYSVWVDGTSSTGSTYCALYSFDYNQTLMGAASFTATGVFTRLLTLPQSQVPYYSSQVVACYMPPNGVLYDIEPVQ
jgi:hypothetical protein